MTAHQAEPVLRLGTGILLGVTTAEGVANLMISNRRRHIECLVPSLLQPEREIEVLRTEWVEDGIKSSELIEPVCPHHHGTTTGDAGHSAVALSLVDLTKTDR